MYDSENHNRRVKFVEYEEVEPQFDPDYPEWIGPDYKPVTKFGFCVGYSVYSQRYPDVSSDIDIVMYDIERDDGTIVQIYEDDVVFLGWKRELCV